MSGISQPIPIDGSGRVLITAIGGDNDDALICTSERDTSDGQTDWFLHPTLMSTNMDDRIAQVCLSIYYSPDI